MVFCTIFAFANFETTFAQFAKLRFSFSTSTIAWLFVYAGVLGAMVQGGMVGRLAKRFGEGKLIVAGTFLSFLALGLLPFAASTGAAARGPGGAGPRPGHRPPVVVRSDLQACRSRRNGRCDGRLPGHVQPGPDHRSILGRGGLRQARLRVALSDRFSLHADRELHSHNSASEDAAADPTRRLNGSIRLIHRVVWTRPENPGNANRCCPVGRRCPYRASVDRLPASSSPFVARDPSHRPTFRAQRARWEPGLSAPGSNIPPRPGRPLRFHRASRTSTVAFEDHQRGVSVLLDLDSVLCAAHREDRRGSGDQALAVIAIRELPEHPPDAAAFNVDEDAGPVVGEMETGLGDDVKTGGEIRNLQVGGRSGTRSGGSRQNGPDRLPASGTSPSARKSNR